MRSKEKSIKGSGWRTNGKEILCPSCARAIATEMKDDKPVNNKLAFVLATAYRGQDTIACDRCGTVEIILALQTR